MAENLQGPEPHVLVVDDDPEIRDIVRTALERDGFSVSEVGDGDAALEQVRARPPDLLILDLGLPGVSGLDVLRRLRVAGDVPVIILSGWSDESDRIVGLELGADDYVVKPFSPRELAVRVETVLRRGRGRSASTTLRFGELEIDAGAREVRVRGVVVDLTAREFDLLAFLADSPRQVFSAEQLLQLVWRAEPEWQTTSTVSEHVYRIRQKLEDDPASPHWIQTVRGAGYRFEP